MTVALQTPVRQTVRIPEPRVQMDLPRRRDSLLLAALPTALSCAYSYVISTLEHWQAPHFLDNTTMLVHELVASAVEQASLDRPALIRINLLDYGRFVIIEVIDEAIYPPSQFEDGYDGETPLLDALRVRSRRWGIKSVPVGKLVWAEPISAPLPKRKAKPTPGVRPSPENRPDPELLQRIVDGLKKW